MKIGILTYQYAMNYGAVLQAYALKTYLETLNHEVEILNYDSSYLYANQRSIKAKIISHVWNIFKNVLGAKKKRKLFDTFRNNYLKLKFPSLTTKNQLLMYLINQNFDAFIVGSDQVWNPEINGHDDTYYLNFQNKALKISYAASFGVGTIKENDLTQILDSLKSFSAVSVREKTGLEILKLFNKKVEVVLDPVFLPNIEIWNRLAEKNPVITGKYMLCYVMPGDREIETRIEVLSQQYKEKTGNQVIFLGRKEYKKFKNDGKDLVVASPGSFVNLFKNADFIVTNSFHGTAFSLIYNKNFYSLVNRHLKGEKQLCSRVIDLLTELGIEDRALNPSDDCIFENKINYSIVNEKLNLKRNTSKEFLKKSLQAKQ